jgi:hypothetical protein
MTWGQWPAGAAPPRSPTLISSRLDTRSMVAAARRPSTLILISDLAMMSTILSSSRGLAALIAGCAELPRDGVESGVGLIAVGHGSGVAASEGSHATIRAVRSQRLPAVILLTVLLSLTVQTTSVVAAMS